MPRAGQASTRGRVAVVGSGIAGLTSAYLLQRRYDVTLFEAADRLGGHSHTHDVPSRTGGLVPVDSGFIVHNERTYPNLLRLFEELGVKTQDTDMSMSVHCDGCGLEYAGAQGLPGLFAQRARIGDRNFLHMLVEITAFHRRARRFLVDPPLGHSAADEVTLGGFLSACGLSRYFAAHFMVPLISTVWSSGTTDALKYPARYLFRFLDNHGMLSVRDSPRWRTVVGGSRSYVEKAAKGLSAVRTSTPVRAVRRHADGVEVHDDGDTTQRFDHVVVAVHADQALGLLAEPSRSEREILGAFEFSTSEAVLHTDHRVLPASRSAWASWNSVVPGCDPGSTGRTDGVAVSYHMNRLQRLGADATDREYVVTLGGTGRVAADTVIDRMSYDHPIVTHASLAAQARLDELSTGRISYAGAWQGWGFHEDGCTSGVRAAARLGVPR